MPATYLVPVLSALAGAALVGMAWGIAAQRAALRIMGDKLKGLADDNAALMLRLANLERVDRNVLYQESLEDQRARQLRAADSVAVGVEHMMNAMRILAPEMLKKGNKK